MSIFPSLLRSALGSGGGGGGVTTLAALNDVAIDSGVVEGGNEVVYDASAAEWRNRPGILLDPKQFGAAADARRYFGLSCTSGSAVVTAGSPVFPDPSSDEATFLEGKTVTLDYFGAADASVTTTIVSVDSTTQITVGTTAGQNKWKVTLRYHGTDDTAAVQTAIDTAVSLGKNYGVLLTGLYSIAGDIVIPDDLHMEGVGRWRAGFQLRNSAGAVHCLVTHDFASWTGNTGTANGNRAARNFRLEKFFIDGNGRNNTTALFGLAMYAFDYDIRDLVIFNTKGVGLYAECNMSSNGSSGSASGDSPYHHMTGPGGIHAYIERVMVFGCAAGNTATTPQATTTAANNPGFQVCLLGPHDSMVLGLDVYQPGSECARGIYIGHRDGVASGVTGFGGSQISDAHAWGNHTIGIDVNSGGTLLDNIQSEGGGTQMRIAGAKVKANHLRLYGVTGSSADKGLLMASGSGCQLTSVMIEDCDSYAVGFSGTGGVDGLIHGTASSDNGTAPPLISGTVPVSCEIFMLGTHGYNKSIKKLGGHAVVAADFGTFSSGWGSSGAPSIAVAAGSNVYRGNATITAGGATGIAANPTVVLTFPKAFTAAPIVIVGRSGSGAGGTSNFTTENVGASSCRIIYGGTPTATATYSFSWIIQE